MPAYGAEELAAEFSVSRETRERLERLAALLRHWQKTINLVSTKSLKQLWRRHMLDSAQLAPLISSEARTVVDLGSGAGFPGLVLAIMLAHRRGLQVHLIESDKRKAAFLASAVAETSAPAQVHTDRIEDIPAFHADVVTARGCAPLARLLGYAARFWQTDTVGLFLKGRAAARELTQARESWRFDAQLMPSRSDASGTIVVVRALERLPGSAFGE